MNVTIFLLILMIVAALYAVMATRLVRAAIGLAITSLILTIIMFRLNSPLAAVFELSVCAGLISVIFISTISMTQSLSPSEFFEHRKARLRRYSFLPLIVIAAAVLLSLIQVSRGFKLPPPETIHDARLVLWNLRQFDLLGQVVILLAGAFGVVVLFKETQKHGK